MEENIISDLAAFKASRYIKTYSKTNKMSSSTKENDNNYKITSSPVLKRVPLTTKNAMKFLLEGTLKEKVCRYCLNVTSGLSELDQFLQFAGQGTLYKVTIRDMVASFHPIQVADDTEFPNKICNKCLDHTISSYLFTQQCERAERALRNCFEDMNDKLDKLDPLERPKKRGRQKLNPNYNILYTDHEQVINYAEPLINMIHTAAESLTTEGFIKDFECPKCSQVLPNIESLLNHEKSHPKSMWYNCRLCGKSFPKRHHWKKHINTHLIDKPGKSPNDSFMCNHCGEVTNDSNEYLRHIEKHKFKVVMEHLVEKKMDELCSVCLDNSSNMTSLDKMVSLHGGHTDMAGDRSLYSVLASTIPEQKLYKYQELVIPNNATILKIVKKDKKLVVKTAIGTSYILSHPFVLTTEEFNSEDVYIFFFSLPLNEAEISPKSVIGEMKNDAKILDLLNEIPEADDCIMNTICDATDIISENLDIHTKKENIIFTFSLPQYVDENTDMIIDQKEIVEDTNEKGIAVDTKHKLCKTCWIFKNSHCNVCKIVEKQDIAINTDINGIDSKPCNYCWLFKHVGKCEYCKKLNEVSLTQNANKNDSCSVGMKKNEINDEQDAPWQCTICLTTNNAKTKSCHCCESAIKIEDNIKIKFGQYSSVFNTQNVSPQIKLEESNTVTEVQIRAEIVENTTNDENIFISMNVQEMEVEPISDYANVKNIIETRQLANPCQESEYLLNPVNDTPEEMDVEESLFEHNFSPMNACPINKEATQVTTSYQFNIGTCSSDEQNIRKFKRAVRKMGRASHK